MSKVWPCKHICWSIFVIGHGWSMTIHNLGFEVPDSWNYCPICGAKRPKKKGK